MLKILHVIASVDPRGGGPIEGIVQQSLRRQTEQFQVHIVSLDPPNAEFLDRYSLKVFALGNPLSNRPPNASWRQPWKRYGYQPNIVPWLRQNIKNYDIVIVNGLWNYATMAARLALVGSRTPYVVFTHGMLDPWFRKTYPIKNLLKQAFWLFNEGPLLNNASAVLFTTEEERVVSRGAFWPYRLTERVVGYGTSDLEGDAEAQKRFFRKALPALGDRQYLLYLSRIHPKKGCDLLIEAFAKMAQDNPEIDLVMAGPDQTNWRPELEETASQYGLAKRIHWPGMLQGERKWGAYRGCEAFVLPSHQENFGIVVAEALAAGRPVLISNKVQIWREIEAGGGGMVEPDDAAGTERLLKRFVGLAPTERVRMGIAARETFLEKFEMSKVVLGIDAALMECALGRAT